MSLITDYILICTYSWEVEELNRHLRDLEIDSGQGFGLDVSEHAGGSKVFTPIVSLMAGNYVSVNLVVEAMRRVKWADPECVQLLASYEHDDPPPAFRCVWPIEEGAALDQPGAVIVAESESDARVLRAWRDDNSAQIPDYDVSLTRRHCFRRTTIVERRHLEVLREAASVWGGPDPRWSERARAFVVGFKSDKAREAIREALDATEKKS